METIEKWHQVVEQQDLKLLKSLVAKDAVFYSPLLFKPQQGRSKVVGYLSAASKMFEGTGFHYVKELMGKDTAILEFNATIDDILIDGVDIISWNEEGLITEFKVMIRPFSAVQKVGEHMKSLLEDMSLWEKVKFKIG